MSIICKGLIRFGCNRRLHSYPPTPPNAGRSIHTNGMCVYAETLTYVALIGLDRARN